jgi:hypothetical protein
MALADAADLAIELFFQGKNLMNAGDYAGARAKLMESARLDPKVGTVASLAVCEERLGHVAEARARWLQARTLALATGDSRRPLTEGELARVDRLVPKLSLDLRGVSPPGMRIEIDGVEVGAGGLGTPLPVDPGEHTVSATAPGKQAWSTKVRTQADGNVTTVSVGPLDDAPATTPAAPTPEAAPPPVTSPILQGTPAPARTVAIAPEAGSSLGGQATAGLLVGGTGVVGLLTGLAFGVQTIVLKNERSGYCDASNVCATQHGVELDQDARTAATISTVLVAAGGAVAAGGLVIFFTSPRGGKAPMVRVGTDVWGAGAKMTAVAEW